MSKIYIFRGVSATGKTTLTNELSRKYHLPVFRKDDVYDSIISEMDHKNKNTISYDVLAKIIQTNIDLGIDIIVDIALPHRPSIDMFLNKINFRGHTVYNFFCICSDKNEWKHRWQERIKNPTPNQLFMDINDIESYYVNMDFTLFDNEIVIDSMNDLKDNLVDFEKYFKQEHTQ